MVVTGVYHSCLLIELGPICNSMAAFLWSKCCEDHSLLQSYNGGHGKTIKDLSPKEEYQACFVGYLLCMWHVKCFWCIVLISVSPIMISVFKKCTFLKRKSFRLQKKSLISRYGAMVCSALHYILDLKHVSCTSALWGFTISILSFIENSLFPISEHLYFLLLCQSIVWGICSCNCQNMTKKALSQVSINRRSGHFIEFNAI